MADAPSQIGYEGLEYNWDGDRAYLPSSETRRDDFYCDEEEYRKEIHDIYGYSIEPDSDEIAAFWHEIDA